MIGKIKIARYQLNAAKSHRLILPSITKCPQSTKITKIARLEISIINGISEAKSHNIANHISFDFSFALINFLYSNV
jgi:hypothetical protein